MVSRQTRGQHGHVNEVLVSFVLLDCDELAFILSDVASLFTLDEDDICQTASLDDFNLMYIRDFLQRTGSAITDDDMLQMPRETLFWNLQIVGGTNEYLKPKNVGLLFFSDKLGQ
jgi:ATP-dependent DNA helicase RecG